MWARASSLRRFTDTDAYTEPVRLKCGKLATKSPRIYGRFLQRIATTSVLSSASDTEAGVAWPRRGVCAGSDQRVPSEQHVADGEHGSRSLLRHLSSSARARLHQRARHPADRARHLRRLSALQRAALLPLPRRRDAVRLAAQQRRQLDRRRRRRRSA